MTQLLPFMLGDERYGLKLTEIQEIVEDASLHYLPAAPATIIGAVNVHGRILPVLDLARQLGFETDTHSPRMIVLARREVQLVLAVTHLESLLSVDLEQGTLMQSDAPDDCIDSVLNWQGRMISLLNLENLKKLVEDECLATGGGHAAARADRR